MTDYYKIIFEIDPVFPLQDILPQEIGDLGYDMFEETENGFNAFIPVEKFNEERLNSLLHEFSDSGKIVMQKEIIKGENWNKNWEESFNPVIEPGKFAICAPFHSTPENVPLIIWIEPRMAFGTGHHPTTHLMARHLIDMDCANLHVLDMGCGTGILSVIAEKRGALSILAVDNEDAAVSNTADTVILNKCTKVTVEKGSADRLKNRCFNLILANINRNVLWEHIPVYASSLNKGGQLWLSGFYSSDVDMLKKRILSAGLVLLNLYSRDDWQLMKCVKE